MGNSNRLKLKTGLKHFIRYMIIVSIIYFMFINLFQQVLGNTNANLIYVLIIFALSVLAVFCRHKRANLLMMIPWLAVLGVVIISSKETVIKGNYYWVMLYTILTIIMVISSYDSNWTDNSIKYIGKLSYVHVIATIVLYVTAPYLYNAIVLPFWNGVIPGGEFTASQAYKAGISNHYSTNGIYCSIASVVYGASWIVGGKNGRKKKALWLCLIAFIAIVITTKRAHLLFAFASLLLVYYICSPKNSVSKFFYVLLVGVFALITTLILAQFLPIFADVMSRFFGQEDVSTGRFAFWAQALSGFHNNEIFGIGWGQYQFINIYGAGVHNSYIQLLCETGMVGFSLFSFAIVFTLVKSIKCIRKAATTLSYDDKLCLSVSIGIQIFVILYCFTGNCFYDLTVIIYYISCMIAQNIVTKNKRANRYRGNE